MMSRNRRTVSQFSKSFSKTRREFRQSLGAILTEAAAGGRLRSGATIKEGYRAFEEALIFSVDECLDLVSKKTSHMSSTRVWLLEQIVVQIKHCDTDMNQMVIDLVVNKATQSPDAQQAAEAVHRQCMDNLLDRVAQYEDGLIAPDDKSWAERFPLAKDLLLIIIGVLMGWLLPN